MADVGTITVALKFGIKARPKAVWSALINDMDEWWHDSFYVTPKPHRITLEAHAGGRMFETSDSGSELLWYTVIGVEPAKSITLSGHFSPPYGGPASTILHIDLEEMGPDVTRMHLTESSYGCISGDTEKRLREGWTMLIQDGLIPFLEVKQHS
ncbi:MAG: hypothetical protein KKA42_16060 [candidate division Zixibacteria bacterium]|nr:hypothetical protein [candidate division Zixibacteria bacterium]